MRVLLDPSHQELHAVLALLLAEDVDISAREVARRHPTIKTVTAFTRNQARATAISEAQARQREVRAVATMPHRRRAESLGEQLERRGELLEAQENKIDALIASHVACVRAVMRHGGMAALERFWKDYRAIGETVRSLGAVPESANVIDLAKNRPARRRQK